MAINKVLKVNSDSELLSFIINSTPELSSEIDLPVQGQSIVPIGKLILNNERYKNAFINTVNVIGLTIIDRNYWEDPWENFTERGTLPYGQHVRELVTDIADVFDYNETVNSPDNFLKNVVPNVYHFMHEVNYQKYYKTTTSDEQISMAFNTEGGLFELIEVIIGSLYEGYKYDKYIVNKYMIARRIIDGTITSVEIENYDNLTARQRVAKIKNVSNLMTFRSPNYNPAGLRKATAFDRQIAIVNTDFEADLTTEVLATSFFRNDAEMKSRLALVDGFGNHDTERLSLLLKDAYIPFTEEELSELKEIPAMIVDDELFQNYNYAMNTDGDVKMTEFYNPESLRNNHWLHTWKVISTSPFKNAVVFTKQKPEVESVEVSPSESTISAGLSLQLTAVVKTVGFANKAVTWSVVKGDGVTVDLNGKVQIPKDFVISGDAPHVVIQATSVYDNEVFGTASITVV